MIAETKLNEQSSRSHTVFRINIQSQPKGGKYRILYVNYVTLDESKIRMS